MKALKVGQLAHITFYDHAQMQGIDDTEPMLFEVFGRVVFASKVHYLVATWVTPESLGDHNAEYFSIIRGAITRVRVLK